VGCQYFPVPLVFHQAQGFQSLPRFYRLPDFLQVTCFSEKRQQFVNPLDFSESANISQIRLIFRKAIGFYEFA
jgi:hypothetical protein